MTANVRLFATEDAARAAVADLAENGLEDSQILSPAGATGREEVVVRAAVDAGQIPGGFSYTCVQALKQGRHVVGVNVPYGWSVKAMEIMDDAGAVDTHLLKSYPTRDPSPFSDIFGMPTLTTFQASSELLSGNWHFTQQFFSMPMLSKNSRGKARLITPKRPWNTSFGLPLLSKDSKGKAKLTSPKPGRSTSFGFPLLSKSAAPLSALLGMPTLLKDK